MKFHNSFVSWGEEEKEEKRKKNQANKDGLYPQVLRRLF